MDMIHAKKKIGAWLALGTLGLAVLTGCGTQNAVDESTKVNVISLEKSSVPIGDTYLGTVDPFVQTSITPAISGILLRFMLITPFRRLVFTSSL